MYQFSKFFPEGKSVSTLEDLASLVDLASLAVKELKRSLLSYREKVSGTKAHLVLRTYALFCRALQADSKNSSESVQTTPSSKAEKSALTYEVIFRPRCGNLPWVSNLRNSPPFSFIRSY